MKSIQDLLNEGKFLLKDKVDTPALDAGLLLAAALETDRTHLLLNAEKLVPAAACAVYRAALERRIGGECVAYIIGYKEFWGLRFAVNPSVLVPRPDTETLVEAVLSLHASSCLDLCTGSGAVSCAIKLARSEWTVTASDVSSAALETARANARALGADVRFVESDLFDRVEGSFDLIVSNPPYIPSADIAALPLEVRNEPRLALDGGADGLCLIRRIIKGAAAHLASGGFLLLEADHRQMDAIAKIFHDEDFDGVRTFRDLSGQERVIAANHA